jgi:hypothetical protein
MTLFNESRSLERPAWTSDDLHAYNHKHVGAKRVGNEIRPAILHDYYIKSEGKE